MNSPEPATGVPLSTLLEGVARWPGGPDPQISDLSLDSRTVAPGACFFALGGSRDDGIRYVRDAAARGAAAVVAEARSTPAPELDIPLVEVASLREHLGTIVRRFFDDPSAALAVVAVTGTNGKTSVAHFTAQALAALGTRCGYVGTLGAGEPGTIEAGDLTTPDVVSLNRWLARFRDDGAAAVVVEASSHALSQRRLDAVRVRAACLTNLGHDHLDYHGSLEAYAASKRSLFAHAGLSHAVLNIDDALGRAIAGDLAPGVEAWTVSSRGAQATVSATAIENGVEGVSFTLCSGTRSARVTSSVAGRFNVDNLLAAGALLMALGHDVAAVGRALSTVEPVRGRMEFCGITTSGARVLVDFAHSPDSLEAVLEACAALAPRRLTVVFGCGGDRDRTKRPRMGAVAERLADRVILTADNPRSERNTDIVDDILKGCRAPARVLVEGDRATAIRRALEDAIAGEIVVVAGKGHESHQQVGALRTPYSDQSVIAALLAGAGA